MHERPNLTYEENRRYRVKCYTCGQFIEFNADSYEEAFALYEAMFEGQTLYPIEDLHEDYGSVLCHNIPICEPPTVASCIDCGYDEQEYTHFSLIPKLMWIEKDGRIAPHEW